MSKDSNEILPARFSEINDAVGFANGDPFDTPAEVREYFTVATMRLMVGPNAEDVQTPDQDDLDAMADDVIANRWHCRF